MFIGQRVFHNLYGDGTILDYNDNFCYILFDGFGKETKAKEIPIEEIEEL